MTLLSSTVLHTGAINSHSFSTHRRLSFIEILKKCYYDQVDNGELDISGDLQYSLFQGLEFSEDSAAKGQPLNDWNATKVASATGVVVCNRSFSLAMIQIKIFFKELFSCKKKSCCGVAGDEKTFKEQLSRNYDLFLLSKVSFSVRQGLAFLCKSLKVPYLLIVLSLRSNTHYTFFHSRRS